MLFYFLGGSGYYDLAQPPKSSNEPEGVRAARVWQQYFNQRFQTYDRFVHLYAAFATGGTAEARRADAIEHYEAIKPFAVSIHAPIPEPYLQEMTRRGVLAFTAGIDGSQFVSATAYQHASPLAWGGYASSELKAQLFTAYICRQLKNNPVSFGRVRQGERRTFGLWFTTDPNWPEVTRYGEQVAKDLQECGISVVAHSYPVGHWAVGAANTQSAATAAADWERQQVSTVIWAGNEEAALSKAFEHAGYLPELVISDDHWLNGNYHAKSQSMVAFGNAVLITDIPSYKRAEDAYCYAAFREVDPQSNINACGLYPAVLQIFTAIQVAGPRLTPTSVDQGFHAIPPLVSKDPTTPSCYYLAGDYTCTKDAVLQYWDPTPRGDRAPYDQGPCWRTLDGAKRHIAGDWPTADRVAAWDRTNGVGYCNNAATGYTTLVATSTAG